MSFNKDGQYIGYIYIITNNVNDKVYVGQTYRSIKERFSEHLRSNDDCYLHRAMRKYGKSHGCVIIEGVTTRE